MKPKMNLSKLRAFNHIKTTERAPPTIYKNPNQKKEKTKKGFYMSNKKKENILQKRTKKNA
jgi:hypothetical protein